ncbi:MAG: electron transport complex subunit RsxE [Haloplasmataceae bacterium]|jgi:electron transport complex protein RnfE|nr:electron transport complex subunit RsxE [Haloplasmataceae bacterium]
MTKKQNLLKGIFQENPVFVLILGMCPVLGVTTSLLNALGMGAAFTVVLILSNILISLIRKLIPNDIRIPAYIVVIATLVTIVDMVMNAFTFSLYEELGIFIPLIVVNCVVLGRAEAYASKNGVVDSAIDALGMGLGYTIAIAIVASIREILGSGELLGFNIIPFNLFEPATIFILAPGAFITLGFLLALINVIVAKRNKKTVENK